MKRFTGVASGTTVFAGVWPQRLWCGSYYFPHAGQLITYTNRPGAEAQPLMTLCHRCGRVGVRADYPIQRGLNTTRTQVDEWELANVPGKGGQDGEDDGG